MAEIKTCEEYVLDRLNQAERMADINEKMFNEAFERVQELEDEVQTLYKAVRQIMNMEDIDINWYKMYEEAYNIMCKLKEDK